MDMTRLMNFLALLLYLIITLLMVCTVVGILVVNCDSHHWWYRIGMQLAENLRMPQN